MSWLLLVLMLPLLVLPRQALAETSGADPQATLAATVRTCTSHRDQGQTLKVDGHWLEAREVLQGCAQESCPIAIRSECRGWIEQLSSALPSVVFIVEGTVAGGSPPKVFVDKSTLTDQAYATEVPIELEPGEHEFRIELEGYPMKSLTLTLEQGQQHRLVRVRMGAGDTPTNPPATSAQIASPKSAPAAKAANLPPQAKQDWDSTSKPAHEVPWLSYGLGLGAIVGVASATGLYVVALTDLGDAREQCAPGCSHARRKNIERLLLIGDAAGAVSLLAGAAAFYLFPSRQLKASKHEPTLGVSLAPGTLGLHLNQHF